jgi:hypothetical protein
MIKDSAISGYRHLLNVQKLGLILTKLHTHKSSHCRSDLVGMIFGQSSLRNNFLSTDDKIYFTSNAKDEFYSDEI